MKIRTDFVTNSSSSSFMIFYKQVDIPNDEIIKQYPLIKVIYNMFNNVIQNESEIITNELELHNFFIHNYGLNEIFEDEYYKEKYDTCIEKLNNGYTICCKELEYDDKFCDFVRDIDNGNTIIVEEG